MPAFLRLSAQHGESLFGRDRPLIRTRRRHGHEHIHESDNLSRKRDVIAAKSVRVSRTVTALVMMAHDTAHGLQRSQVRNERLAEHGVRLNQGTLVGIEATRLEQHRVWNREHAYVVQ